MAALPNILGDDDWASLPDTLKPAAAPQGSWAVSAPDSPKQPAATQGSWAPADPTFPSLRESPASSTKVQQTDDDGFGVDDVELAKVASVVDEKARDASQGVRMGFRDKAVRRKKE
jgi:hypothetical protein